MDTTLSAPAVKIATTPAESPPPDDRLDLCAGIHKALHVDGRQRQAVHLPAR